ncbi:hypothetical protein D3C85_1884700 [compost metagenome]
MDFDQVSFSAVDDIAVAEWCAAKITSFFLRIPYTLLGSPSDVEKLLVGYHII